MKITLVGYAQDQQTAGRVRFKEEVELPAVPRVGDIILWEYPTENSYWRVKAVYWNANTQLVQVNVT